MGRVAKKNLRLFDIPPNQRQHQLLSAATEKNRPTSCKLQGWFLHFPGIAVIYSDEQLCNVLRKLNSQNDPMLTQAHTAPKPNSLDVLLIAMAKIHQFSESLIISR